MNVNCYKEQKQHLQQHQEDQDRDSMNNNWCWSYSLLSSSSFFHYYCQEEEGKVQNKHSRHQQYQHRNKRNMFLQRVVVLLSMCTIFILSFWTRGGGRKQALGPGTATIVTNMQYFNDEDDNNNNYKSKSHSNKSNDNINSSWVNFSSDENAGSINSRTHQLLGDNYNTTLLFNHTGTTNASNIASWDKEDEVEGEKKEGSIPPLVDAEDNSDVTETSENTSIYIDGTNDNSTVIADEGKDNADEDEEVIQQDDGDIDNPNNSSSSSSSLDFSFDNDTSPTGVKLSLSYNVFWCGYRGFVENMTSCLFDDAQSTQMLLQDEHLGNNHDVNDVLVVSYRGPCFAHTPQGTDAPDLFHGQIVYVMGEAFPMYPLDVRDRLYALSYMPTDGEKNIRSFFGAMYVSCSLSPTIQSHIFDTNQKVMNSGERFLIYTNSHCVRFRDKVFATLSHIGRGPAYYGGRCQGTRDKSTTTLLDEEIRSSNWGNNHHLLGKYRFALVMENTYKEGYITEKIINAFLAGCVPIYYGTREVMDIFNPKAFVFYDVQNPRPALDLIAYLESNETAYLDMLRNEPILRNGTHTMQEYFSYSDKIGDGILKKRIRTMMGFNSSVN